MQESGKNRRHLATIHTNYLLRQGLIFPTLHFSYVKNIPQQETTFSSPSFLFHPITCTRHTATDVYTLLK